MKLSLYKFNKINVKGENMKYLSILFSLLALTFYSSCGSDSTGGSGGIGPGGGGGTGSVTFTIQGQATGANYNFYFKPSVDVKVSRIIANLPAQPYSDTITNTNTAYVFSKDSFYTWYEYQGITTGMAWNFVFSGNIVSGGSAYTSTANFTVP